MKSFDKIRFLDVNILLFLVSADEEPESDDEAGTTQDLIDKIKPNRKEKQPWTQKESKIVLDSMHEFLVGNKLPGKNLCETLIKKNECLHKRKWTNVKDFVRNHKLKLSKRK